MPSKNIGKKIKNIRILKSGVKLTFFDGEKLTISNEAYTSKPLFINKVVSNEDYQNLKQSKDLEKHINYVYRLLTKSAYSEFRIREKLYAKELNKKDVDYIVNYFKHLGLINDVSFAKEYASYLKMAHLGKNKIIYQLSNKGIFKEIIDDIPFTYQEERNNALYWLKTLEKRYAKMNMNQKRSHVTNFLINKGFDNGVINEVLKYIKITNSHDVYDTLKKDFVKAKARLSRKYHGKELKEKIMQNLLTKGYKLNEIIKVMEG